MAPGTDAAAEEGRGAWLDRVVTRKRVRMLSTSMLVVSAVLYAIDVAKGRFPYDAQGTIVLPDFLAHLTGGTLVADGRARVLYDVDAQSAFQTSITGDPKTIDLFLSPPLTALLYVPFARLSYGWATIAWTLVSLALVVLSARMILRLMPSVSDDDRRLFFLAFAASPPLLQLLGTGQDTGITLLLWTAGTTLALERRDAAAGAVFALGLFKPQLFLLPPLVLVLSRRRAFAAWTACALALAGLTVILFGTEGIRGWLAILRSQQYVAALRTTRALRMASVVPLFLSIVPSSYGGAADALGKGVSGAIALLTLGRILPRWAGGARDMRDPRTQPIDERGVWALACVATLLVTPHLFCHDLTLLVLPAALLLEISGAYSRVARRALVALALLTLTGGLRIWFEASPWPLRLLAASWAAVPMFLLWREIPTAACPHSSPLRALHEASKESRRSGM
jgi:hypothetical protein